MRKFRSAGFTLTELLVSIAILAVLAALLFPVFRTAVDAAKRTACLSNYRQIGAAITIYTSDYDDSVPPVNYKSVEVATPENDRSWVQTLLPYVGSFQVFICPSDSGRQNVPAFTDGSAGGDPAVKYYSASLRSNLGYNYLYFSPLLELDEGEWKAFPIKLGRVANPSGTLMFIDSVWDRTDEGVPYGGGSWAVTPPCRYVSTENGSEDTFDFIPGIRGYFGFDPVGWQPSSSKSWLVYGGAWPWHHNRFNMMFADGRAKSVTLTELTDGCDFGPEWQGDITNLQQYIWDLDE